MSVVQNEKDESEPIVDIDTGPVLRGKSPKICPLRARVIDEIMGVTTTEPELTEIAPPAPIVIRVRSLDKNGFRSFYNRSAVAI
jgi:hypothetical protein